MTPYNLAKVDDFINECSWIIELHDENQYKTI